MHGQRALTAACAVVVLVVGQLSALAHAAATRHVICERHGEELEATTLSGAPDHCAQRHFVGVEAGTGAHEECGIARVLRQGSHAAWSAPLVPVATIAATQVALPRSCVVAVRDVVLIAPKTSPPVRAERR